MRAHVGKPILSLKMGFGGQRTEFGGCEWFLPAGEEPHPLAPPKQQMSKARAAHFRPLCGCAFQDLPFKELLTDHPAPSCSDNHAVAAGDKVFKLSPKPRIWFE